MLAWRTLKWWQRLLVVVMTAYFVGMFWFGGPPGRNLPSHWTSFIGVITMYAGMLLNPASVGAPLPARGWRGWPMPCKVLILAGVAADLFGLALMPFGV